ncbi:hypothetical protein [Streptomyces sp. NPDC048473]|uniref:hypothetical protein n=1 Tax=unclassified Streptomyces TaxID=2593676 RepID=UPI00371E4749
MISSSSFAIKVVGASQIRALIPGQGRFRLLEDWVDDQAGLRDISKLAVLRVGRVEERDDPLLPFRLLDTVGGEVEEVSEFLREMLADDASPLTLRSYAYELLGWFRFLLCTTSRVDQRPTLGAQARDW